MTRSDRSLLLRMAEKQGVLTARDVRRAGIHSQQLTRLVEEGILERIARGQYRLSERPVTEHHGLVMAQKAVPRGVICLLSALQFHGIGTQLPADVWIAVRRGTRSPSNPPTPLRIVRFSGDAFTEGIERHRVEGVTIQVYGVAKTLSDLFKYRGELGVEVAVEALREAWRDRRFVMADLTRTARACRVERVMEPYLEAVIA
jgi:predicted transcriptional regulator of viral defense system